jgi:folate-binding protein YgfZ
MMHSPLLDRPGAVAGTGVDAPVPAHYGDPMGEQRRLEEATGTAAPAAFAGSPIVDLSHRGVFTVTGADRLSWLNDLTTQHLADLRPGQSSTALLLSPNGHVEHALYIVATDDAVWVHTEPEAAPAAVAFLRSMQFMLRVEIVDHTDDIAILWRPGDPVPTAGGSLVRQGADSLGGHEVFVPRSELGKLTDGARLSGSWAYEARRIAAHVPRFGFDTDHKAIPNELGWLDVAVHLAKGCYRGQETVARVHNLGRPPRRLVFLHLDGSVDDLPVHGAKIVGGGREVGLIGSAARHYELGPIALALVKRSIDPALELLVEGTTGQVAAAQEVVVPPDLGLHVGARL